MLAWAIPSEEEENEVKPSGEQKKIERFILLSYMHIVSL